MSTQKLFHSPLSRCRPEDQPRKLPSMCNENDRVSAASFKFWVEFVLLLEFLRVESRPISYSLFPSRFDHVQLFEARNEKSRLAFYNWLGRCVGPAFVVAGLTHMQSGVVMDPALKGKAKLGPTRLTALRFFTAHTLLSAYAAPLYVHIHDVYIYVYRTLSDWQRELLSRIVHSRAQFRRCAQPHSQLRFLRANHV